MAPSNQGKVRIWLMWDQDHFSIDPIPQTDQVLVSNCRCIESGKQWYLGIVYARNFEQERTVLWNCLEETINTLQGAWLLAGDFNCIRYQNEKKRGNIVHANKLTQFNNFIESSALSDLKVSGANWTWINKQEARPIACKLDRVLINDEWLDLYPNSSARAYPPLLRDHTPILLNLTNGFPPRNRSFKYFNHWPGIQGYKETVEKAWKTSFIGNPSFQLTMKIK